MHQHDFSEIHKNITVSIIALISKTKIQCLFSDLKSIDVYLLYKFIYTIHLYIYFIETQLYFSNKIF